MINYIIAIIFLLFFTSFLVLLGKNCFKKLDSNKGFSINLLVGYTVYTFVQAIGGIIVQVLKLNWFMFFWYMITSIALMCVFIFIKEKKNIKIDFNKITVHLKNYWFLYAICTVLLFFSLINFEWSWMGNSMDDGRYLNLVATYPYTPNPYTTNAATGLPDSFDIIRALNTFELEYSFWVYFLKIDPSIFTRFAMTFFNYFLTAHGIYALAKIICNSLKLEIKESYYQYVVAPLLIFGFYFNWLIAYRILEMQDSWQFSTAMWYGSSIVRITGIFLCIVPIIEQRKIDLSVIIYCFIVSVVLISKASQALPMVILLAFGYLVAMCLLSKNKVIWVIPCIMFIGLLFVPQIPTNFEEIEVAAMNIISYNSKYFLWYFSFVMILVSFILKNKLVFKWNIILIIFAMLMWVPKLNTLFVDASMYNFVAARTTTLFIFTIVMSAFIYLFVLGIKFLKRPKVIVCLFLAFGVSLTSFMCYEYRNTIGLKRGLVTLIRNPNLFPKGTYELSKELEKLYQETGEELNVLTQNGIGSNGYVHALSISLRTYAPHINSISAVPRYSSVSKESPFCNFSQEDQWTFEAFNLRPYVDGNIDDFIDLLERYPINCVIAVTEDSRDELLKLGFDLYKEIYVPTDAFSHFIMYK